MFDLDGNYTSIFDGTPPTYTHKCTHMPIPPVLIPLIARTDTNIHKVPPNTVFCSGI